MLGSLILYLKGMRIMMFQLSGFYCSPLCLQSLAVGFRLSRAQQPLHQLRCRRLRLFQTPRAWGERQRRRPRGSQKATEERVSAEHCIDRGREGEREGGREGGRERGRERRRGRGSGGEADMEMENQMRRLVRCRHAITTTSMIKMIAMTLLELIRAF